MDMDEQRLGAAFLSVALVTMVLLAASWMAFLLQG